MQWKYKCQAEEIENIGLIWCFSVFNIVIATYCFKVWSECIWECPDCLWKRENLFCCNSLIFRWIVYSNLIITRISFIQEESLFFSDALFLNSACLSSTFSVEMRSEFNKFLYFLFITLFVASIYWQWFYFCFFSDASANTVYVRILIGIINDHYILFNQTNRMCLMRRQTYASVKQIISGILYQKTMWRERPRLVHQRVRRLLPIPRSRIYWQCLCNALRECLAAKR